MPILSDPLQVVVEAKLDQAQNDIQVFARDTQVRLDQARVIELQVQSGQLDLALVRATQEFNTLKQRARESSEAFDSPKFQADFIQAQNTVRQLRSELTNTNRSLENLRNTGDEATSRLSRQFNGLRTSVSGLVSSLVSLVSIREVFRGINTLADATDSFESAFAGFRKTLEATEPELIAIEEGIINLSKTLPSTTEELSKIAETGGQFGIAARDILNFTETVAQLSTAIDGVNAEEAARQLAVVLGLTGDSIQNIDELGSSLVELGNNFRANEGQILNFAERIAGSAGVIGIASSEVLAISAAFVDAGINAEAGGTAVSKVFDQINFAALQGGEQLERFSTISGIAAADFNEAFENDPAEVFRLFVDGLADAGREGALVLDDLGLSDQRLRRAFLSTANAGGTLERAISSANEEFTNSDALLEENAKRLSTNTSQLQIQANQWRVWQADVGESLSGARVSAGEFFLDFLPTAFSTIQFAFARLANGFNVTVINLQLLFGTFVNGIAFGFASLQDVFISTANNGRILADNLQTAFTSGLPQAIESVLNGIIGGFETLLNVSTIGIRTLIQQANSIPGVDISSSFGEVTLGRVNIPGADAVFREFEELQNTQRQLVNENFENFARTKQRELDIQEDALRTTALRLTEQADLTADAREGATEEVINTIEQEIAAENQALQDYIDGLTEGDDAAAQSSGSRSESATEAQEAIEEAAKLAQEAVVDSYDTQVDAVEDLEDSIRDNIDAVVDLRDEYQELQDSAVDALQNINQELRQLDNDEDTSLAERRLEILEEQLEIQQELSDINNIDNLSQDDIDNRNSLLEQEIELKNELNIIDANTTEEIRNQVAEYDALNEAERILFDNQQARQELTEQALVQSAIQNGRDIQVVQDDENGVSAFVENEKGELIELQNFKTAQDAIELENQRDQLQSRELALLGFIQLESNALRESYDQKAELERAFSDIVEIEATRRIQLADDQIDRLNEVIRLQQAAGILVPQSNESQGQAITTNNVTNNVEINNATAGGAEVTTSNLITNISSL